MIDLGALVTTFATIFVVELPDKTFVATLVLSTRYRPLAVWLGVGLAFGVQTAVAVLAGQALAQLPADPVRLVAAGIFALGAVLLLRAAPKADAAERSQEATYARRAQGQRSFAAAGWLSFVVIVAAEWGDLSQLLTVSLVQRFDPVSVFAGAWLALLAVSGLAAAAGRLLLQRVRLSTLHYAGASVCLLLAGLTTYEVLAG